MKLSFTRKIQTGLQRFEHSTLPRHVLLEPFGEIIRTPSVDVQGIKALVRTSIADDTQHLAISDGKKTLLVHVPSLMVMYFPETVTIGGLCD